MCIRDRVYAAGCILPLTSNENVSAELGTRHRAALGMSENSDAVVVVVSEETGQISIAMEGKLTRNYNRVTLREVLEKNLIGAPEEKVTSKMCIRDRCERLFLLYCYKNIIPFYIKYYISGLLEFIQQHTGILIPVSYTHLDVYKRQSIASAFTDQGCPKQATNSTIAGFPSIYPKRKPGIA